MGLENQSLDEYAAILREELSTFNHRMFRMSYGHSYTEVREPLAFRKEKTALLNTGTNTDSIKR